MRSVEGTAGRPTWDPQMLVSLWIYSYSQGVAASSSEFRTKSRIEEHLARAEPAVAALDAVSEEESSRQQMHTDEARAIYKTRAQIAEFPNLWIKAKLGLRQFRVRGLANVKTESRWTALTYNIQQWIRLRCRAPMTTTAPA